MSELPTVDLNSDLFKVPASVTDDLYKKIEPLDISELTTKTVNGSGVFDALMTSLKAHLREEYEKQRITGAEYSQVYVALVQAAMSTATQFILSRDQAFWQAQQAQIAAINGRVALEVTKASLVQAQLQTAGQETQNEAATYNLTYILPNQKALLEKQVEGQQIKNTSDQYTLTNVLPKQMLLVTEQYENQRAQTMDVRSDGTPVSGVLQKQKDLYTQQITSYQRNSEINTAKLYSDAWTAQKAIDEGLLAPDNFTNATLDVVLNKLRTNLGMV